MLRRLLRRGHLPELTDPSGQIVVAGASIDPRWIGLPLTAIEEATGTRVAYFTRLGEGALPDTIFQEGLRPPRAQQDEIVEIEAHLDGPPPVHE